MRTTILLSVLLAAVPSSAQVLVKNVRGPGSDPDSRPEDMAVFAGHTFFAAFAPAVGQELWKTDGTTAGTAALDLLPGTQSSQAAQMIDVNGTLFFTVDAGSFTALWKSDGTVEGSVEVLPSGAARFLEPQRALGDLLLFVGSSAAAGRELWRSDGTPAGTFMLKDIAPGTTHGVPGASYTVTTGVAGGRMFFAANQPGVGEELWVTDGTTAGTVLVADLEPGSAGSSPRGFVELGGQMLFSAQTSAHGRELWRTDGTEQGTQLVADIVPGGATGQVEEMAAWQGRVYFSGIDPSGSAVLWSSDGTAAGTRIVAPGSAATLPRFPTPSASYLYFSARHPTFGAELWRTDGTAAGTVFLGDLEPGSAGWLPVYRTALGSGLLFVGPDPNGTDELWWTDGSPGGTRLLRVFESADDVVRFGSIAIFSADDGTTGEELWTSDGTAAGTRLVANLNPPGELSSRPVDLTWSGDQVFFGADVGPGFGSNEPRSLWASDGTTAGTREVRRAQYGPIQALTDIDGTLFFTENPSEQSLSIFVWKIAAGAAAPTLVWSAPSSIGGALSDLTPFDGAVLIGYRAAFSGSELYRIETGQPGATQLTNLGASGLTLVTSTVKAAGSRCYFDVTGLSGGTFETLWATNGQPGGAFEVPNIVPYEGWARGSRVALGDALLLAATDAATGAELWRTDGTEAGTSLVRDLRPGPTGSAPQHLTVLGGTVYFTANDGVRGRELWKTDGTAMGTVLVADLLAGPSGSVPSELTAAADLLYFSAVHATAGRELFVTDGTEAGTRLLRDINPNGDSDPRSVAAVDAGRYVFFAATTPSAGSEAWISDGTTAGTLPLGDLEPGPAGSMPVGFTRRRTRVLFAASQTAVGRELFGADLAPLGVPLAEPYGAGCSGSGGAVPALSAEGAPIQGAAGFAVRVDNARPSSPGALLLSGARAALSLGECALLVGPWVAVPLATSGTGTARLPLPVPPGIAGAELALQALVLDPAGGLLGAASATQGLALLIGR